MRKYTLRELKNLVRCGMAHDLTNATAAEVKEQWRHGEKIGYSSGTYGINGGLIQNTETGEYYAITARNSNLFFYILIRRRTNDFNFIFDFTVCHCSERGGAQAVRLDPVKPICYTRYTQNKEKEF